MAVLGLKSDVLFGTAERDVSDHEFIYRRSPKNSRIASRQDSSDVLVAIDSAAQIRTFTAAIGEINERIALLHNADSAFGELRAILQRQEQVSCRFTSPSEQTRQDEVARREVLILQERFDSLWKQEETVSSADGNLSSFSIQELRSALPALKSELEQGQQVIRHEQQAAAAKLQDLCSEQPLKMLSRTELALTEGAEESAKQLFGMITAFQEKAATAHALQKAARADTLLS